MQPSSAEDFDQVAELFHEYAAWLDLGACSRNIEREIDDLPSQYGPPDGCLFLARQDGRPAGCVALRRFSDGICEMKRLHVRPAFRGRRIGRALAVAIIDQGRRLGYHKMRLDTIADRMTEAISLYNRLGFREIGPYGVHAEGCTTFMELDLRTEPHTSDVRKEG